MEDDRRPVLIVTTKGGKLVEAGQPDCFTKKRICEYTQLGYKIKTITIAAYRKKNWIWNYETTPSPTTVNK